MGKMNKWHGAQAPTKKESRAQAGWKSELKQVLGVVKGHRSTLDAGQWDEEGKRRYLPEK